MQGNKEGNLIVSLTFDFALKVIVYCGELEKRKKFVVANQLLRSGTGIGANVREAQNAESRNDFIHKLKIAAKEADETVYWLMLCNRSKDFPSCENLITEVEAIIRVLSKIIGTLKRNK